LLVKWLGGILTLLTLVGCGNPTQSTVVVPPVAASDRPAPPANSSAADRADEVPIDDPNRENVVTVAAAVFPPRARPGDVVTLAVRFRTALGWHFFAVGDDGHAGPVLPTTLNLDLPAGATTDGDWELPEPDIYDGPTGRGRGYDGDVTFRRRITIDQSQSPGVLTLPLTVGYQACNDSLCVRPAPAELRPTLDIRN
jgi:DsbC/DsbD-like thiol-disulfide interchange protein